MTSFVSVKTMLFKLVGMIASIPSGLAIGPEGKRRKACIRVK
jgi:H+/Cl- antiporter ClcA